MKTLVLVPSIFGTASKSLIHNIVNSGSWFSNSSFVGRINKFLPNRFCHTWSLITLIGKRFSGSEPTKPSKTKSSLFSTKLFIFSKSFSNLSLGNWWLIFPQSIVSRVLSSCTIKRSSGDRPVYFPVLTEREPVEFMTPSFRSTARLDISSTLRFLWTLEGLIPNSVNCDENLSVTALPTTWVRRLYPQKLFYQSQIGSWDISIRLEFPYYLFVIWNFFLARNVFISKFKKHSDVDQQR